DKFLNWDRFFLNAMISREEMLRIVDEWDTKCHLTKLHYRDSGTPIYPNEKMIFLKKAGLFEEVKKRERKDDSDRRMVEKYDQYLKNKANIKVILGEGWEESPGDKGRWVRRKATFYLDANVGDKADIVWIKFYVPDTSYYPGKSLKVVLDAGGSTESLEVVESDEYMFSTRFAKGQDGDYLCTIESSEDFRPADVMDTEDTRPLSIVMISIGLSQGDLSNIVDEIGVQSLSE
ncbi:MAG: hypothetical protein ACYTFG_07385, partial [Planctomycetota bacterium]